jgi:hypothetical protein
MAPGGAKGGPSAKSAAFSSDVPVSAPDSAKCYQINWWFLTKLQVNQIPIDRYTANVFPILLCLKYVSQITRRDLTFKILKRCGKQTGVLVGVCWSCLLKSESTFWLIAVVLPKQTRTWFARAGAAVQRAVFAEIPAPSSTAHALVYQNAWSATAL